MKNAAGSASLIRLTSFHMESLSATSIPLPTPPHPSSPPHSKVLQQPPNRRLGLINAHPNSISTGNQLTIALNHNRPQFISLKTPSPMIIHTFTPQYSDPRPLHSSTNNFARYFLTTLSNHRYSNQLP